MKIILKARGAAGYAPDQVTGIKVKDLKELLENYQDDDEIITYDMGNKYGAPYGKIYADIEDEEWDIGEEDEDYE